MKILKKIKKLLTYYKRKKILKEHILSRCDKLIPKYNSYNGKKYYSMLNIETGKTKNYDPNTGKLVSSFYVYIGNLKFREFVFPDFKITRFGNFM